LLVHVSPLLVHELRMIMRLQVNRINGVLDVSPCARAGL
jgi:hypothetical protein